MSELVEQLLTYGRGIWRRRWLVALVACLFSVIGWVVVAFLPDTYLASGRIYVDTRSVLGPLLSGVAVQSDVQDEVKVMTETLLSRPNLEKLARLTDRDVEATNPIEQEELIEALKKATTIKSDRANIFTISFSDVNAVRAQKSVQTLINIFVESNLGASREDMDTAHRFIDQQIQYYERELEEAERRLADFKRDNLGLLPGPGGYDSRLEQAFAALREAEAGLQDAIAERDALKKEIASVPATIAFQSGADPTSGQPAGIEGQLLELRSQLNQLLYRFTDQHPDVISLKRRIAILETAEEELQQSGRSAQPAPGFGIPNPTHTQLTLTLAEKEALIATLQRRVERQKQVVKDMESKALTVPIIEAELSKLTRDYGVLQSKYEDLLSRRESAKIARERGATGEEVQFRIVEPPIVPTEPNGPNRPLLITAVLVLSLGAGGGAAAVLTLLSSTYNTVRELRADIDLPVLGTVTQIITKQQKKKLVVDYSLIAVLGLLLIVGYGGSMLLEKQVGLGNIGAAVRDSGSLKPALQLISDKFSVSALTGSPG